MPSPPLRKVLTVIMDAFVILAVAETARLVVLFFGTLAAQGWGQLIVALTDYITLPLGLDPIKTPYGGVFDVDTAVTIGVLLVIEWVLSIARNRD